MKIFTIALVIISVFMGQLTYAQVTAVITPNQFQAKAEAAYDKQDYNAALANYMSILTNDPDRSDLYWRAAECARYTRHFKTAEFYYEAFAKKPELSNTEPLLFFKLAGIKKNLQLYDAAIALYQKYVSSENTKVADEALSEINQLKWAKSKLEEKKTYEVERLKENVQVNTIYIDAAPVQYGSTLYYTTGYVKTPESTEGGSNVYTSNLVTTPKMSIVTNVFSSNLKDKPLSLAINSQAENIHTAYYAPNTEGSRLYYNLCEQTESASFNCKIYVREKGGDGTWANPKKLGSAINIEGFTATQPNVGFDKDKGKDVLYFVSDRKGGKGGLDIWAADIEADGTVNAPINLSINTRKDDVTPFFMNGPQMLMFSSDGDSLHSFGGFDIFKSQKSATGFGDSENIGYPMNSSYDDMYASFTPENAKYYFVSNRPGGLCGSEKKDCVCNDIYEEYIKANLDVSTFLADGGKALTGCLVNLVDAETGKRIKEDMNANSNDFKFAIEPNKKYRLIASKQGYMPDTVAFNTLGLYQPVTTISQRLVLKPNLKIEIYVFDRIDRKPIDGALVKIRSDVDSSIVASETLKGNLMTWSGLEFGKTYRISAFKDNFGEDNKKELIGEWSSTITKFVYKDSLYLTPFSGLPLTLYYDNDNPDPRSRKMTTIYTYGETFASYYAKQAEYLNGFYKDNRDISSNGANEISEFFEKKIKFGYDKLNNFSTKLIKYLQNGKGMEIVLEGYASPLAETEYNRILTSRRVSAVINHFYKYNSGLFRPYIKNGQLRLRIEPYGEDKSKSGISDDVNDRRQSVYSVAAMSERKVEILQINVFDYDSKMMNGGRFNENLGMYLDRDDLGFPKQNTTLEEVEMENRKGTSSSRKRKGKGAKTSVVTTTYKGKTSKTTVTTTTSKGKGKGKKYKTTSSNESNIDAIYGRGSNASANVSGSSSSNMSIGSGSSSSNMSIGSGSSSNMSIGSGSSSSNMSMGSGGSSSNMSIGSGSSSSNMSMGSGGSSSNMSMGSGGSSSNMSMGSGSSSSNMSMGSGSSSSNMSMGSGSSSSNMSIGSGSSSSNMSIGSGGSSSNMSMGSGSSSSNMSIGSGGSSSNMSIGSGGSSSSNMSIGSGGSSSDMSIGSGGSSSSNMSMGSGSGSSNMSIGSGGSSSDMSIGSGGSSSSNMSMGSGSGSSNMSIGSGSSSSNTSMGSGGSSSNMSMGSGSSSSNMSMGSGSSSNMSISSGSSSNMSIDANANDARIALEAKMAKAAADELAVKTAQELALAKAKMVQQRHEIVLVDTYTGELINNEASVELFEQSSDKMLSKAKRSGKSYYFNVDLSKDYLIRGSADGYSEATVTKYKTVYTEGVLSMTSDTMYLTPFSGLPLALYFDNDKPAGATEATTTTYEATYHPFIARKREFISSYNKMMGANGGMMDSENSMNSFFDNDIKGGYDRLVGFSNILKSYLQRGNQIEIVVEGYASPLANSEYNHRLSVRRVNSIVNHFSSFGGGTLKKYITSGQLKITIQSHGEVSSNVSDDVQNKSSVYSLEASRERKVVIKDIVILNNSFFKK